MNIQYLAQALCLINKYLMILSTTRAVFGPRPVAGRRKTKARELTERPFFALMSALEILS